MKRIQRKREKGWQMPKDAIYVGRPSKWGNPVKLEGDQLYVHAGHRRKLLDPWVLLEGYGNNMDAVLTIYHNLLIGARFSNPDLNYWSKKLHGRIVNDIEDFIGKKYIVCWCGPKEKCHADILLKIIEKRIKSYTREKHNIDIAKKIYKKESK